MKNPLFTMMGFMMVAMMLFFAIPFPMIIYYVDKEDTITNPLTAMIILSISLVLWLVLLTGYFKNWILSVFKAKRHVEQLKIHGISRQAEILSSQKTALPDTLELTLSFKNLVGTVITETLQVTDSKPYENRFEKGKTLELRIDEKMNTTPYLIAAYSEARISAKVLLLKVGIWLLLCGLVAGYYYYAYTFESNEFLNPGHPLFVCALILFVYKLILLLIIRISGPVPEKTFIKFNGIRTSAAVKHVSETGVEINDQPQVKFVLEYTDNRGVQHTASVKKVLSLLNLDMAKQPFLDIYYVPSSPEKIAFADDLS